MPETNLPMDEYNRIYDERMRQLQHARWPVRAGMWVLAIGWGTLCAAYFVPRYAIPQFIAALFRRRLHQCVGYVEGSRCDRRAERRGRYCARCAGWLREQTTQMTS
jgi:hypothetical protein